MLKNLFPRLFGQYREGGLIVGKWTISSGAGTKVAAETHNDLSLAYTATGLYTLTMPKCRKAAVLAIWVTNPDSDDPTDACQAIIDQERGGVDAANGKVYFTTHEIETAHALAAPPDGSQIHVALYVDK